MVTSEVCRVGFWCTDFGKNPSVRYRKCVVTRIDSDRGFPWVLDLSYALVKSRHGNDGIEVLGCETFNPCWLLLCNTATYISTPSLWLACHQHGLHLICFQVVLGSVIEQATIGSKFAIRSLVSRFSPLKWWCSHWLGFVSCVEDALVLSA
jgi:hypothetical protein